MKLTLHRLLLRWKNDFRRLSPTTLLTTFFPWQMECSVSPTIRSLSWLVIAWINLTRVSSLHDTSLNCSINQISSYKRYELYKDYLEIAEIHLRKYCSEYIQRHCITKMNGSKHTQCCVSVQFSDFYSCLRDLYENNWFIKHLKIVYVLIGCNSCISFLSQMSLPSVPSIVNKWKSLVKFYQICNIFPYVRKGRTKVSDVCQ